MTAERTSLTEVVSTRLTPELESFLISEADRTGTTPSGYLRLTLARAFLERSGRLPDWLLEGMGDG